MKRIRLGEVLHQMGKLSRHDIDEILHEQTGTEQRFGTIALASGFCLPEDIWVAWCRQLGADLQQIDLASARVDAQASAYVPREIAQRLRLVPVRVAGNDLVIAIADAATAPIASELLKQVNMRLRFSLAPLAQIESAIADLYDAPRATG